ncbi:MAG: inositol monophosphatase [Anaerolineae bacterium]|nr:inositol monophosphatase [Anaerolineae bacterium]
MSDRSPLLETAIAAARAAGEVLTSRFARPHEVSYKGLRDLVTEADLLAQEAAVAVIRREFPEHEIVTEEAGLPQGSDRTHRWYLDPLDGTTNYARGIPCFSVSIALECSGALAVGVVYDPMGGRLFHACLGAGAFLNGARLRVSERDRLLDALLDLGWARSQQARLLCLHAAEVLGPEIGSVRTMGSAALGLAAVAAGWEDVYYHPELAPWDMAAGVLLIREAGGRVTATDGSEWHPLAGGCLASNGLLHQAALLKLRDAAVRTEGPS